MGRKSGQKNKTKGTEKSSGEGQTRDRKPRRAEGGRGVRGGGTWGRTHPGWTGGMAFCIWGCMLPGGLLLRSEPGPVRWCRSSSDLPRSSHHVLSTPVHTHKHTVYQYAHTHTHTHTQARVCTRTNLSMHTHKHTGLSSRAYTQTHRPK